MKKTLDTVNMAISNVFYDIIKLEEHFLKESKFKDISHKEARTIDMIANSGVKKMSEIAKKLDITVGTLTVSVSNLEKKGYVMREKSLADKRVVNVVLTKKGQKLFNTHQIFKESVTKSIVTDLTKQEKEIFKGALNRFSDMINKRVHKYIN